MSQVILSWDKKIATITLTPHEKSMNVLDRTTLSRFISTVDEVLENKNTQGVIITSSSDSFIAGVDLNMLGHMIDPTVSLAQNRRTVVDFVWQIDQLFRRLETAGFPVVAAMTGTTLGGGFELALATHYRIAIDNPHARIGLPETQLGIFPGLGGTVRLTRLLGVEKALRSLIPGKTYTPAKALKAGLIDAIATDQKDLIAQAKAWIDANCDAAQPWDKAGYRMPGGLPYSPRGMMTWAPACALSRVKTANLYPAIRDMLICVYRGCLIDFDQAMLLEAKYFVHQLLTPQAQRMIKTLFIARQQLREPYHQGHTFSHQAVFGAGFMGQGIATLLAQKYPVYLFDHDLATAEKAKESILIQTKELIAKGIKSPASLQTLERHIKPTNDLALLADVDVVIEAVFEDIEVKKSVFQTISSHTTPECLILSNTSTLPMSELSQFVSHPERFCGLHFFSPVARMSLVEVIPSQHTHADTQAAVMSLSVSLGKTPIAVSDSRGFFVNQVLMSYCEQAYEMIHEGVPTYLIEKAALQIGMPVGPLQLSDEVGLDVIWHILKSFNTTDKPAAQIIHKLFENKCFGKKSGEGFYSYQGIKKTLKRSDYEETDSPISFQDIKDRLFYSQMLRAAELYDQGVIQSPWSGDYAAVFGWGFCPWTGGPFRYFDDMHRTQFIKRAQELRNSYGQAFHIPEILEEWAQDSQMTFYQTDRTSAH